MFRHGLADDAAAGGELLGWDPKEAETLMMLDQGVAMVQIGSAPPVVCSMIMSDFELEVGDTNQAMTSRSTVSSSRARRGEVDDDDFQEADR